jgi:hypothetical protein
MLLYILTKNSLKFKEPIKCIWHYIILQYGVVVWWPKHWCGTKKTKV